MRSAVASTLVVPLAVVLVACGTAATAAKPTPPPVRIGAIYNLTGAQAPLDAPSLDGARLAVDRINAHGGLMGRRVELLERDGQTNEDEVRRAAASLVASGCSAIIGLSDTDQVLAAAPIAASAGVPFVTSGATSPRLTQQIPNWLFLACFGDNAQAAASAQFATDQLGARTAAILYDEGHGLHAAAGQVLRALVPRAGRQGPGHRRLLEARAGGPPAGERGRDGAANGSGSSQGESQSSGSRRRRGELHGRVGLERRVGLGGGSAATRRERPSAASSSSASESAAAPAAASADVLFVAAGPEDAARIVSRLRAAGFDQPIMGGDSFDSPTLISAAEKTGGKVYYTTHAAVGMSSASRAVRRFDASYQAAYGLPPENAFAALGYDAVDLVAAAIRRADSVRPAAVRDALQATRHFPGVTGTLSYDAKDRVPQQEGDRGVRGPAAGGRRPVHAGLRAAAVAVTGRRTRQLRPKIARK